MVSLLITVVIVIAAVLIVTDTPLGLSRRDSSVRATRVTRAVAASKRTDVRTLAALIPVTWRVMRHAQNTFIVLSTHYVAFRCTSQYFAALCSSLAKTLSPT